VNTELVLAAVQSASLARDLAGNVEHHIGLARQAITAGARLVVFPELSLTGYELAFGSEHPVALDDERLAPLRALASAHRVVIVAGAPVSGTAGPHIGALVFGTDGEVGVYAKRHLHSGEDAYFHPGTASIPLTVADAKVSLAICADIDHDEHAAQARDAGADLYAAGVLMSANGLRDCLDRMAGYARDHRMAVLMANHAAPTGGWTPAGTSTIWAPDGSVVASARSGEAIVIARRRGAAWSGEVLAA
jgi:predicted amidohydrolase